MISQREERKTQKYEELRTELHKIYKDYKVKQINIVMDFLANFGKTLPNELKSLGIDSKEILIVLQQSQKWIMTKNCNIVKRIYEWQWNILLCKVHKVLFFLYVCIFILYI